MTITQKIGMRIRDIFSKDTMSGQRITIIDNLTMESVGEGKLSLYSPDVIIIRTGPKFKDFQRFNARTVHVKGCEPDRMLVWKDEVTKKGVLK